MIAISSDERRTLKTAFHLLARNLFTYAREPGTFSVISDRDRKLAALRAHFLEEFDALDDEISNAITRSGDQPDVGSFLEVYTSWSFISESALLPRSLAELVEHRRAFIRLRNKLTASGQEPSAETLGLLDRAIDLHAEAISACNAHAAGICEPGILEDAARSLAGKITVAKAGGHHATSAAHVHHDHGHHDHGHHDHAHHDHDGHH